MSERLTESDLKSFEQLAQKYGSANSWTASHGTLATALLRCVREIRRLRRETKGSE